MFSDAQGNISIAEAGRIGALAWLNPYEFKFDKEDSIMSMRDLLDLLNQEKKRKQRVKAARMVAAGVGIATVAAAAGVATGILIAPKSGKETRDDMKDKVLSFNESVQRKTDAFKKAAAKSAQAVGNAIKDIHGKTDEITEDAKDGLEKISHDVGNTAEHIAEELNDL